MVTLKAYSRSDKFSKYKTKYINFCPISSVISNLIHIAMFLLILCFVLYYNLSKIFCLSPTSMCNTRNVIFK